MARQRRHFLPVANLQIMAKPGLREAMTMMILTPSPRFLRTANRAVFACLLGELGDSPRIPDRVGRPLKINK
jgi:hypothetical protein